MKLIRQYAGLNPNAKGEVTVFVLVHGYKGSQHDFTLLKDIIARDAQLLKRRAVILSLDYAFVGDTRILRLGNELAGQLRRRIIASLNAEDWEIALQRIDRIHFVGFSLGNVVIESLLS